MKTKKTRVTPLKRAKTTHRKPVAAPSLKKVKNWFQAMFDSTPTDIVDAIKMDHRALRNFLDILKDTDQAMTVRKRAYTQFADLLKSHSTSEERAVYLPVDEFPGRDLHIKVAEGFAEHQLASDLMKRIEKAKDATAWSAHANVLAEIVKHHLDEEESDLLPMIERDASIPQNEAMLAKYLAIREKTQKHLTPKNQGVLKDKASIHQKIDEQVVNAHNAPMIDLSTLGLTHDHPH